MISFRFWDARVFCVVAFLLSISFSSHSASQVALNWEAEGRYIYKIRIFEQHRQQNDDTSPSLLTWGRIYCDVERSSTSDSKVLKWGRWCIENEHPRSGYGRMGNGYFQKEVMQGSSVVSEANPFYDSPHLTKTAENLYATQNITPYLMSIGLWPLPNTPLELSVFHMSRISVSQAYEMIPAGEYRVTWVLTGENISHELFNNCYQLRLRVQREEDESSAIDICNGTLWLTRTGIPIEWRAILVEPMKGSGNVTIEKSVSFVWEKCVAPDFDMYSLPVLGVEKPSTWSQDISLHSGQTNRRGIFFLVLNVGLLITSLAGLIVWHRVIKR